MCGIAGLFQDHCAAEALYSKALNMASALKHRGPDDWGIWTEQTAGLALAHRRLAILDLSPEGHQPMLSACGRWVLVFNGEIYNFLAIRRNLELISQHHWRGHSDTEVMLAAIAQWGLVAALQHFVGMFACALWDRHDHTLTLFRDRLGEKPLYYGFIGQTLLFASELKALQTHPDFSGEINRDAVALLMRYGYVDAPHSIYKNVYKLPPGTYITFTPTTTRDSLPQPYWSAYQAVERGLLEPFRGNDQEAITELERLLMETVSGQMISDVPLGAFLSGGIDSSTVVAMMQAQSTHPVRTFSIGFWEQDFNEATYAKAVAAHLGTDHTELYVTAAEALEVIPRLPTLYDEPFADSSQIPTALVAALARSQVTVSLSGDGGDELFCGYNRYLWATTLWRRLGWLPTPLRQSLAATMIALPPSAWDKLFKHLGLLLPKTLRYTSLGDKLHKLAAILEASTPEHIYHLLVSFWLNTQDLVPGSHLPTTALNNSNSWPVLPYFEQHMMYLDLITYLPGDILVKLDRAAMGVSLESRVPLLDHRIVEFAWRLPLNMKLRGNQGKWLLRQVLYRHVPPSLLERPKMGFGIPLAEWLRGPLREWAETMLNTQRLHAEGWLNVDLVRSRWHQHLNRQRNWSYYLWNVLAFQSWLST